MKRYIKSAVILLAALSLAGCAKTEEFQCNPDSALQIESVSGISPFSLMQEPASKAVISGETLPGDEAAKGIGLFVTAIDGSAYDGKTEGYSNVNYTYSASKWNTATPVYLSNTTGKLYGYFPYNADATDLAAVPVESSLNGTDYLYATKQDVSFSNKSVNLQMNHALARLHLTIKKGDKYLSDCNLSKIVLQSKAIDAEGTLDITTGAVTATKAVDATGTFELTGTDAVTASGIEKDILLVPASTAEGKKDLTLILTIDGVEAKVNFTGDNGLDLRSGIQCNATLTIEDIGIKVSGVGIGVWNDQGSQQVQVGAYTVTVKLSDDEGIVDDVLTNVKVDGNDALIRAFSCVGNHLKCTLPGGEFCPQSKTDKLLYTFTLSDIESNITATIGYAKAVTITKVITPEGKGTINMTGDCFEGETVTFKAIASNDAYSFVEWQDADGKKLDWTNPQDITLISDLAVKAVFYNDYILPGVFTVNGNGKKVQFSKGNLYYNGTGYYFENNQYDVTSGDEISSHLGLFYWSPRAYVAISLEYYSDSDASGEDTFFANHPESLEINGQKGWSVLTGGSNGEWKYLINKGNECGQTVRSDKCKYGVTICEHTNCLVLLPDDWEWNKSTVGTSWQEGGYPETSIDGKVTWKTMEAAGAVCLPAAGFRNGSQYGNPIKVSSVGNGGYYWSASPSGNSNAFALSFGNTGVNSSGSTTRNRANAIRLVTEVK